MSEYLLWQRWLLYQSSRLMLSYCIRDTNNTGHNKMSITAYFFITTCLSICCIRNELFLGQNSLPLFINLFYFSCFDVYTLYDYHLFLEHRFIDFKINFTMLNFNFKVYAYVHIMMRTFVYIYAYNAIYIYIYIFIILLVMCK